MCTANVAPPNMAMASTAMAPTAMAPTAMASTAMASTAMASTMSMRHCQRRQGKGCSKDKSGSDRPREVHKHLPLPAGEFA